MSQLTTSEEPIWSILSNSNWNWQWISSYANPVSSLFFCQKFQFWFQIWKSDVVPVQFLLTRTGTNSSNPPIGVPTQKWKIENAIGPVAVRNMNT